MAVLAFRSTTKSQDDILELNMSAAQIANIFRIVCLLASTLTLFSVIGYFTFSTIAGKEKTARIDQLASSNLSLAAQVAEYEDKFRLKAELVSQLEKDREVIAQESSAKRRAILEQEKQISDQEAALLLGPTPPRKPPNSIGTAAPNDRSRRITPERYVELVTALRTVPPSDVEFLFNDSDSEATILARQLSSALAEAGFRRSVMPPPGTKFEWKPPVSGVRVAIAEGRPVPPMVPPFTDVLRKSGIQVDGVVNPNVPKTAKPLVWIIVGTNPSSG